MHSQHYLAFEDASMGGSSWLIQDSTIQVYGRCQQLVMAAKTAVSVDTLSDGNLLLGQVAAHSEIVTY